MKYAAIVTALFIAITTTYINAFNEIEHHTRVIFANVNDVAAKVTVEKTEEALPEITVEQYEQEYEEAYVSEAPSEAPSYTGDGFKQQGVREHDGRTESWYSSNTLYHQDTEQWSVDEEGYYRDDQGRYVVAASDMPIGTEFETSKGKAVVLDDGCAEGVTDFYVNY